MPEPEPELRGRHGLACCHKHFCSLALSVARQKKKPGQAWMSVRIRVRVLSAGYGSVSGPEAVTFCHLPEGVFSSFSFALASPGSN